MAQAITTLEELEAEAARFARGLTPATAGATLVTLSGELGAGKTAFVKAVAKALGVEEVVTSPTFVLLKSYPLPKDSHFKHLHHIDAYRLTGANELAALWFESLMEDSGSLIFLEWPEQVPGFAIPHQSIALVAHEDGSRTISYAQG